MPLKRKKQSPLLEHIVNPPWLREYRERQEAFQERLNALMPAEPPWLREYREQQAAWEERMNPPALRKFQERLAASKERLSALWPAKLRSE